MTDRELTGDEAQRALSEAVRRTRATSAALVPAETVRSKQIADALKLLQRVTAECDGAPTDHAWRTCKRCTAIHGIEMRFGLTMRLLNAAIEALASSAVQPEPPTTQAVSPQDLQVGGDHASSSDLAAAKAPRSHKRGHEADDADVPKVRTSEHPVAGVHLRSVEGDQSLPVLPSRVVAALRLCAPSSDRA